MINVAQLLVSVYVTCKLDMYIKDMHMNKNCYTVLVFFFSALALCLMVSESTITCINSCGSP